MSAFVKSFDARAVEDEGRFFSRVEVCASVVVSEFRVRIDEVAVSRLRERVREAVEETVRFHIVATPDEMKGDGR
ncbi:MAG: hypothetical protein IJL06_00085 [Kiritimatiellae bacterium]|nr:hypothetical protein [Kiritimatiellia bacterium]